MFSDPHQLGTEISNYIILEKIKPKFKPWLILKSRVSTGLSYIWFEKYDYIRATSIYLIFVFYLEIYILFWYIYISNKWSSYLLLLLPILYFTSPSLKVIEHLKVTFELSMTIRKVHIHYCISTWAYVCDVFKMFVTHFIYATTKNFLPYQCGVINKYNLLHDALEWY